MSVQSTVDSLIGQHKVAIFSKSYCPYCTATKSLVKSLDLPASDVGIIELDEAPEGGAIQDFLQTKTGQRTVPNVFINGQHIGGNSDLQALNSKGGLQPLLAKA